MTMQEKHNKAMEKYHGKEIEYSLKYTREYSKEIHGNTPNPNSEMLVKVINEDSVEAILNYAEGKTAVLNFASYKYPGGGYILGAKAQEEDLCAESYLYNVLSQKKDFYEWNKTHLNKGLYLNRALYTPKVLFYRKGTDGKYRTKKVDVITCAAPNYSVANQLQNVSHEENTDILKERIRFVLDIASIKNVETLILGAYGCGAFGQNPTQVAGIFKKLIKNYGFKSVYFAIPDKGNNNYETFYSIFRR